MENNDNLRKVIARIVSAGWQLDPEAFLLIQSSGKSPTGSDLAHEILAVAEKQETKQRIIGRTIVEQALGITPQNQISPPQPTTVIEPVPVKVPEAASVKVPEAASVKVPEAAPVKAPESATTGAPELSSVRVSELKRVPGSPGIQVPLPQVQEKDVEERIQDVEEAEEPETRPERPAPSSTGAPRAVEIESRIKIIKDPSATQSFGGSMGEFTAYFKDRFERMKAVMRARTDVQGARTISAALEADPNEDVRIIAMMMDKRERGTRLFVTIDDLESSATVLFDSERDHQLYEMAAKTPLDQVVCMEVRKSRSDLLIGKKMVLPDIPDRKPKGADEEVYAALMSDVHVGSKKFLENEFKRVLFWLNGKLGDSRQVELARKVKYVIIAGDLVDGIGVYPRQEEELAILDVYEQYKLAAQFIEQIPDYMDVIIIPGNHDAARQALPQPPIMREFAEPVYEARKVLSLGNPCEIELHGVRFLLHHGKSLEDILTSAPGMSFDHPEKGMELQLKCRHLAPEYGKRTSIAPIPQDYMVIENPPDIFQSGHIHVFTYETYRGTLIVNSGAWQSQTDFQKRQGLTPHPGILPIVNLQTLQLGAINFMDKS